MPYTPPGILVRQVVEAVSPIISTPVLEAAIVGPNFSVIERAVHATRYDATADVAPQSFTWPSKGATEVVDFTGVRSGTGRFDGSFDDASDTGTFRLEGAVEPVRIFLQDPVTSTVVQIAYGDLTSVDQTNFTIASNAGVRNDRVTVTADLDVGGGGAAPTLGFTGAELNHFYFRAGGLLTNTVSVGDRVRVSTGTGGPVNPVETLDEVGVPTARTAIRGTITAASDDDITLAVYDPVDVVGVRQAATIAFDAVARIDGDLDATPGRLADVAANAYFPVTNNLRLNARLNIGQEDVVAIDATTSGATLSIPGGGVFIAAHEQRRVVVGVPGAINLEAGTWTLATNTFVTTANPGPFVAADIGARVRVVLDAGGSADGRIVTVTNNRTVILSGVTLAGVAAAATITMFVDNWRRIRSVNLDTGVATLNAIVADGVNRPIIIYTHNYRNFTRFDDDTITYAGTALVGVRVPVDVYDPGMSFEIFPNYQVLASYRALRTTNIGEIIEVNSTDDLTGSGNNLIPYGAVVPANPLVFNMNAALEAMGTTDIRVAGIPIDLFPGQPVKSGLEEDQDADQGYSDALTVLGGRDLYSIVPLTRSVGVRGTYVAHVTAFSLPEDEVGGASLERRALFTAALPRGNYETTRAVLYPFRSGANKQLYRHVDDAAFTPTLQAGDSLVITSPIFYAGTYEIESLTADIITLLATIGPAAHNPSWAAQLDQMVRWTVDGTATEVLGFGTTAGGAGVDELTVRTSGNLVTQHNGGPFLGAPFDFVAIGDVINLDPTGANIFRNVTAVSDTQITFDGGPLENGAPGVALVIYRQRPNITFYADSLSKDNQASNLKAVAESIGSRRATIVWPDTVEITVSGAITPLDSYPLASALAGMCSSEGPEIPFNDVSVGGIDGLRNSNTYFDRSQLNTIASGGVSVYIQDTPSSSVVLRHQLTTDMSVVENAELSIIKNLDSIAKTVRTTLRPSLRRAVVTPRFLRTIEASLQAILTNLERLGQLVGFDGSPAFVISRVARSTTDPRTVEADVTLGIPYPATYVTVTLII